MIADALKFFGAEIAYFARNEKPAAAEKGYRFMPLDELLSWSEAVFCCLNKNTVLLHEAEFEALGNRKILFNTGLSPAWDEAPFARWLEGDNLLRYIGGAGRCEIPCPSARALHAGIHRPHPPGVRPPEREGAGQSVRIRRVT